MGLFDFFRKPINKSKAYSSDSRHYKFDTLEHINSIPVPTENFELICDFTQSVEYVLQRKATEHKRAGNMELAIACLRKSNEIMDYSPIHYSEKDYIRLVEFLKKAGLNEEASAEEEQIYSKHPEFLDKRFSNLARIKEAILKNNTFKNDYVLITTNRTCPICSKYNRKVFSTSNKGKKYPKLPIEFEKEGGFCPNCIVTINLFFDGISSIPKDI